MAYTRFISYSHAADGRLVAALQRGLQLLARSWTSRRALRIFRNETGVSTKPHLWSAIDKILEESEWLVLLASERDAPSEWVNKGMTHWPATKAGDPTTSCLWSPIGPGSGTRLDPTLIPTHRSGAGELTK